MVRIGPLAAPLLAAALALTGLTFLGGCTAKSLAKELPGSWWLVCRTRDQARDRCPGRSLMQTQLEIRTDGSVVRTSDLSPDPMAGTWTLEGSSLDFTYEVPYYGSATDHTEARLSGDYLVLWFPGSDFGQLYLKEGVAFEYPKGQRTGSGRQTGTLGDVRYSLDLPGPHRLTFDEPDSHRWDPLSGQGMTYEIFLRERAVAESIDGTGTVGGCDRADGELSMGSSSSQQLGEPERLVSIHASLCLSDTPYRLGCRAKHTRGYIEARERESAEAVCGTLARKR